MSEVVIICFIIIYEKNCQYTYRKSEWTCMARMQNSLKQSLANHLLTHKREASQECLTVWCMWMRKCEWTCMARMQMWVNMHGKNAKFIKAIISQPFTHSQTWSQSRMPYSVMHVNEEMSGMEEKVERCWCSALWILNQSNQPSTHLICSLT